MSLFKSLYLSTILFTLIIFPLMINLCFATNSNKPQLSNKYIFLSVDILKNYRLSQKEINNDKRIYKNYSFYSWNGTSQELQKLISKTTNPKNDLLMITETSAQHACAQNLLLLIPNAEKTQSTQCILPAFSDYTVLAWDNKKINFQANWKDFWNIARYPGKRGLQKDALSALTIALLADGVPANQVYNTLSTYAGVIRALHKLNQLRPYIVWWTDPKEANLLLQNNKVLMTSASAFAILRFNQQHNQINFGSQPQNALENRLSWIIPSHIKTNKIKAIQQFITHYSLAYSSMLTNIDTQSSVQESQPFLQKNSTIIDKQFNQWLTSPNKP